MRHWEQNIKPPYPALENDDYFLSGVCWLLIQDTHKKIDFRKDDLYFEVKYSGGGKAIGSVKDYLIHHKNMGSHIFNYLIGYDEPFTISIQFQDDMDISGLIVKTEKIQSEKTMTPEMTSLKSLQKNSRSAMEKLSKQPPVTYEKMKAQILRLKGAGADKKRSSKDK